VRAGLEQAGGMECLETECVVLRNFNASVVFRKFEALKLRLRLQLLLQRS
jgi:hypothetical protein